MTQTVSGFKLWFFLFKWWLFGKTFCPMPLWAKKIAKFMCKILWLFIGFSVTTTVCWLLGYELL